MTRGASCQIMWTKRSSASSSPTPSKRWTPRAWACMRWCVERGRKTRPDLEIGICGEHGGDADSVKFCHQIGLDYVSASPFRVPIARLAAAQAVVEEKQKKAKGKKK